VFNMGCGFVAVVAADQAPVAAALLAEHHPGTRVIGRVTDTAATVTLPGLGIAL
jgi:phosphoribosylformylglycinamidine cyclo-ligase